MRSSLQAGGEESEGRDARRASVECFNAEAAMFESQGGVTFNDTRGNATTISWDPFRAVMARMEAKLLDKPDETRHFEKGKVDLVTVGGAAVGRAHLEPGWKWSVHVKPVVKTKSCEAAHFQYHISGVLHVAMDDGTQRDIGPGEVSLLPPGHDAWVVGNEPVVIVDFQGMTDYAKQLGRK